MLDAPEKPAKERALCYRFELLTHTPRPFPKCVRALRLWFDNGALSERLFI